MSKEKEVLKRKISQIWIRTKKDLDSILNETSKLLKNGEKHLKEISEKKSKEPRVNKLKSEEGEFILQSREEGCFNSEI